MDIFELSKKETINTLRALYRLKNTSRFQPEQRKILLAQACDRILSHMRNEEDLLYPALRTDAVTRPYCELFIQQNRQTERILTKLYETPTHNARFEHVAGMLHQQLTGQFTCRQQDLVPRIRRTISAEKLETVGRLVEETMQLKKGVKIF